MAQYIYSIHKRPTRVYKSTTEYGQEYERTVVWAWSEPVMLAWINELGKQGLRYVRDVGDDHCLFERIVDPLPYR